MHWCEIPNTNLYFRFDPQIVTDTIRHTRTAPPETEAHAIVSQQSDGRLYRRLAVMVLFAFLGLWLMGDLFLWMQPATDMDRECLGRPASQMYQCEWEFRHRGNHAGINK